MSDRVVVTATIVNRYGLHARPAMELVDVAAGHACAVTIRKGSVEADGKSIMQVMLLSAERGSQLEIECVGDGSRKCADAIKALIDSGFSEDER
ncbi:MAG: HPr family phosphocarrier protein [Phycisphaeraceae bacterium]|nr:HPr family phosphocarrier protein [Phycisphaeraceae bacterium]